MRLNLFLPALLALTLGVALADDAAPSTPSTPSPFASSLKQLASSGTVITLLAEVNGQSTVVATVNPDGTLNVTGDLRSATTVRVNDTTYTLAAKVTGGGTLFVTMTTAQGTTQTLPLIAAVQRAAAAGKSETAPRGPATSAAAQKAAEKEKEKAAEKAEKEKPASTGAEVETPEASTGASNAAPEAGSGSDHAKTPPAPGKPPKGPPAAGGRP